MAGWVIVGLHDEVPNQTPTRTDMRDICVSKSQPGLSTRKMDVESMQMNIVRMKNRGKGGGGGGCGGSVPKSQESEQNMPPVNFGAEVL
jgi:hypothetical protein